MFTSRRCSACLAIPILFCAFAVSTAAAQTQDVSDSETDPVKLFERGQDAHAKHDYKTAILLYESAIKLKPEFPEAEFQRAIALLAVDRKDEAIQGFKRAVDLRPDWELAYAKFGVALAVSGTLDNNAEPILRKAIELNDKDLEAIVALARIQQRHGDYGEALKLIRAATSLKDATARTWQTRAFIEADEDTLGAISSISHALEIEPRNPSMRIDRARLRLANKDTAGALSDLDVARDALTPKSDLSSIFETARLYARAGKPEEGLHLIDSLDERIRKMPVFVLLRADLTANGGSTDEDRVALEQLLQQDPKNAGLLARLGNAYRTVDPVKSQDYYYRALQLEPNNAKFATGYAAALVQSRRFADAVVILRKVLEKMPDDHVAHANLALALYELKDYASALPEYEWLKNERPEVAVTYFYIATAHDKLGQYQDALTAYEKFLSLANSGTNKLEIEKVNLRLPSLRAQLKRGQGRKQSRP
jgi:tetratricopeptide (TPR) repeat protein